MQYFPLLQSISGRRYLTLPHEEIFPMRSWGVRRGITTAFSLPDDGIPGRWMGETGECAIGENTMRVI
jgi:hypothetical protein